MKIRILPIIEITVDNDDKSRCDPECRHNADGDGEYCYLFNKSIYWNERCIDCLRAIFQKGKC
jgi:hypothetical protein